MQKARQLMLPDFLSVSIFGMGDFLNFSPINQSYEECSCNVSHNKSCPQPKPGADHTL